MERLAATKNEILAELHKDVFLTPKGMIKFVQLFVVICAFAMTTSASGRLLHQTYFRTILGSPIFSALFYLTRRSMNLIMIK